MGVQWPQSRTPSILQPALDSPSGRSYRQSIQTPGALSGRKDKVTWYVDGTLDLGIPSGKIVRVAGAAWRLTSATARVRTAPVGDALAITILAQLPGTTTLTPVLSTPIVIGDGDLEGTPGVISPVSKVLPIGTLIRMNYSQPAVAAHKFQDFGVFNSASWVRRSTSATAMSNFKNLAGTLWRIRTSLTTSVQIGHGDLERSTDGGVTWTISFLAPDPDDYGFIDIVRTPSGKLFTVLSAKGTFSPDNPLEVHRSSDNGDSWSKVYTLPSATDPLGGPLMADPNDSAGRVFGPYMQDFSLGNPGEEGFFFTLDDGASWTKRVPTTPPVMNNVFGTKFSHFMVAVGQSGRLVMHNGGLAAANLYYADDDADNWTGVDLQSLLLGKRQLIHAEGQILFIAGNVIVSGTIHGRIARTDDNGATWTMYLDGQTLSLGDVDGIERVWGIAYDPAVKTLYAHCNDIDEETGDEDPGAPLLARVEGGPWRNITANSEGVFTPSDPSFIRRFQIRSIVPLDLPTFSTDAQELTVELGYRTRAVAQ